MMCYKDKTFCSFYAQCGNGHTCTRALKEDVKIDAEKLNLLICTFAEKPDCFTECSFDSLNQQHL